MREILVAVGLVVAVGGGFYGYRWYVNTRDQAAHADFAYVQEKFENLMSSADVAAWQDLAAESELGYKKHSSSGYAPYFKAIRAEALLREGKRSEALVELEDALKSLGTTTQVYYLYATKLALMKYDSDDAQVKEAGSRALKALAGDVRNPERDEVIYKLGLIAFINEGRAQALEIWQPILAEEAAGSVWASLARERLENAA